MISRDIHWLGMGLHVLGGAGIVVLVVIGNVWWAVLWVTLFGFCREATDDFDRRTPSPVGMTLSQWFEAAGWMLGAAVVAGVAQIVS